MPNGAELRRFAAKICQTVEQTVKIPQQTISESAVRVWAEIASSTPGGRYHGGASLSAGFGLHPIHC